MIYHVSHRTAFTQAFSFTTNIEKDGFDHLSSTIAPQVTQNYRDLKKMTLIPFWSTISAIATFKKIRTCKHLCLNQKNGLLVRQILGLVPIGGNLTILMIAIVAQVIKKNHSH